MKKPFARPRPNATLKLKKNSRKSPKNSWNFGMTTVMRIAISTIERRIRIGGYTRVEMTLRVSVMIVR